MSSPNSKTGAAIFPPSYAPFSSNEQKQPQSSMSAQEDRMFKMYGRMPSAAQLLNRKLQDRKYFDSGDYALCKAGKTSNPAATGVAPVGVRHPDPDSIPHTFVVAGPGSRKNSFVGSAIPRRSSIVASCCTSASDSLAAWK